MLHSSCHGRIISVAIEVDQDSNASQSRFPGYFFTFEGCSLRQCSKNIEKQDLNDAIIVENEKFDISVLRDGGETLRLSIITSRGDLEESWQRLCSFHNICTVVEFLPNYTPSPHLNVSSTTGASSLTWDFLSVKEHWFIVVCGLGLFIFLIMMCSYYYKIAHNNRVQEEAHDGNVAEEVWPL